MSFLAAWQKDLASSGWTVILSTVVDILLVAAVLYWLIMLSRRTRAWKLVWGIVIFLSMIPLTEWTHLQTLNYLLRSFLPLGSVIIAILFYPEIRRALEEMSKIAAWGGELTGTVRRDLRTPVEIIASAADTMSQRLIGALIVIQREHALEEIIETGTRLDAEISEQLILAIFNPGGALHDGAIIVKGARVVAAGCTLPLSASAQVGTMIHTRHKAALGVAEETDAAVVVVSEETGTISLAVGGKLHRDLDQQSLLKSLKALTGVSEGISHRRDLSGKFGSTLKRAGFRRR